MKSLLKTLFVFASVFFLLPFVQASDPVISTVAVISGFTVVVNLVTPYVNMGVLGMNGTNNISARLSYDGARDMFYDALRDKFPDGPAGDMRCREWVKGLVLTQGEVRFEVELNALNNIFKFGVVGNQANTNNIVFPTERRLPLQDSICITELQLFVMRPISRTSTAARLRTYGNTSDFTAAAAAAIDSTLYSHGNFTFTRNNQVLVPYRSLMNWYYQPETQQTAALGAGSPGDQLRGVEDASCTCEPNIVLIGSSNNIPQIELPSNLAVCDEFSRVILIGKGPYAQQSTVVN